MPKGKYDDSERKLIGGMWKKESKAGNAYVSIAIEDPENPERKLNLVGFKNDKKKGENSPDYFIFFSKDQAKFKKKETKETDSFEDDEDDL
jgi:uncharacterized protein (DUF736 family)